MHDEDAITGDGSAITSAEALVREHIGWMLALAENLLRNRDEAQDAIQEAFIAALRGLLRGNGAASHE